VKLVRCRGCFTLLLGGRTSGVVLVFAGAGSGGGVISAGGPGPHAPRTLLDLGIALVAGGTLPMPGCAVRQSVVRVSGENARSAVALVPRSCRPWGCCSPLAMVGGARSGLLYSAPTLMAILRRCRLLVFGQNQGPGPEKLR